MYKLLLSLVVFFLLSCGGGGGGSSSPGSSSGSTVLSGQFKDSNTSGLTFSSGGQAGTTSLRGEFTCESNEQVSFSVGAVDLGSAQCKTVVNPISLVTGSSSTTTRVLNLVRFLLMIDVNNDPSDGIEISNAVQVQAQNWAQVDFNTTNLPGALTAIMFDVATFDGRTPILPDAATAKSHLEQTFRCSYAGAFRGTYTGTDQGNVGVLVSALDGFILGVAYSTLNQNYDVIAGVTPIDYDAQAAFASGITLFGANFYGAFESVDSITGNWDNINNIDSGMFTASRIGGSSNATYRYTGYYTGDDYGLFSIDIDDNGDISALAYSAIYDELSSGSGSVVGSSVSGSVATGAVFNGTVDLNSGITSGTWLNSSQGISGTFSGNGCKLN